MYDLLFPPPTCQASAVADYVAVMYSIRNVGEHTRWHMFASKKCDIVNDNGRTNTLG